MIPLVVLGSPLVIVVLLIIVLLFGLPSVPIGYNRAGTYGYYPSAFFGVIVLIILVLLILKIL